MPTMILIRSVLAATAMLAGATAMANVSGVHGGVISGATGLEDPSQVSQTQYQFAISFADSAGAPTIYFDNLSFGYTTTAGGSIIASQSWPAPGVTYISSDQSYIAAVDLRDLTPGTTYTNNIWAIDSGNRFDYTFQVTTASAVTPVPEPETYAMLLAGLGLVGAVARRRQSSNTLGATPCAS